MTATTTLAAHLADAMTETVTWLEDNALAYGVFLPVVMVLVLV